MFDADVRCEMDVINDVCKDEGVRGMQQAKSFERRPEGGDRQSCRFGNFASLTDLPTCLVLF